VFISQDVAKVGHNSHAAKSRKLDPGDGSILDLWKQIEPPLFWPSNEWA